MSNQYLEHCKNMAASIDPSSLQDMRLGEQIGSGSGFAFYHLGRLSLIGVEEPDVYTGLKVPHVDGSRTVNRARSEVTFAGVLSQAAPELIPFVPDFMNIVQVKDTDVSVILTEDVSANGRFPVVSMPASPYVRTILAQAFEQMSDKQPMIRDEECDRTVSFDVAGQEKLLDFTPLPVDSAVMRHEIYRTTLYETSDALPDLTITVDPDSTLGRSLIGY